MKQRSIVAAMVGAVGNDPGIISIARSRPPDCAVRTIAYLLTRRQALLPDADRRPVDYFGKTVHESCSARWKLRGGKKAAQLGIEE